MTQFTHDGRSGGAGVPRGIFLAAGALVLFTIAASGAARVSDVGTQRLPSPAVVDRLSLRFEDRDDGGVTVRDAETGKAIYVVQPGTNGFVRASVRGFVRIRKLSDIDATTPFTLTRWTDGELSFEDPTTGRRIELGAFGPTNAQAFALLFHAREVAR